MPLRALLCGVVCLAGCATVGRMASPTTPAGAAGATAEVADACPRAKTLERPAVAAEVQCLLQQYVRLRTVDPPGDEIVAARFLAGVLRRDGVEARIVETAPGRANLFARLPARAPSRPPRGAIMLVHHMDTVPFSAEEWSVPPLGGEVRDGYLWGRGSFDDKADGAVSLLALLLAKRTSLPLSRDLIVLGVADEEAGSGFGARALVAQHRELFDHVDMVLNEGGGILDLGAGRRRWGVEVSQKAPLWLRITAHGPSGHGSMPEPDSAINVLLRALGRLTAHRFETIVLPEVASMYAQRAALMPEPQRSRLRDLARALRDPAFEREFLSDPRRAGMVRNTLSITMLSAGDKENVIPPTASAVADVRLLPGQDAQRVTAELVKVMDEPAITVEPILSWTAHASPVETPLLHAIERLAHERDPGAPVITNVIAGFTDCNAFRAAGLLCYGFYPMRVRLEEVERIHGKDERVAVGSLADGVLDLLALLQLVAPAP